MDKEEARLEQFKAELKDPLICIPRFFKLITKPNKKGVSLLVPMKLWKIQEHYLKNRTHKDICVKNRQAGFSTAVMAGNAHSLFFTPYERQVVITHDYETSIYLLQTIERFYRNLPAGLRPTTDWKSGERMRFPKLDSYIFVASAQSENLAIGRTLSRAHLSEMAKWSPKRAEDLFADVTQTVDQYGYITIESTPKGRAGKFYQLYDAAKRGDINYQAFFYPWWWDDACVRAVKKKLEYTKEEEQIVQNFELTPEQIAFRREKISELGDLFFQEYPENDIDCWLSGEMSVFDGVAIRWYLQHIINGKREGHLTIWKDAIGGEKYVMGVDVAGGRENGDYSVASILNVKRNEYVACLRGRLPPDLFAEQVLRLGHRYNECEIAVERTGHGHMVLRILMENDYPNIYHHLDYDSMTGISANEPGWNTTKKTKPIMIDILAQSLRAMDLGLWSENFLLEASSYYWDGHIAKSVSGAFDDELDALMIALQLREQAPIADTRRYGITTYARM